MSFSPNLFLSNIKGKDGLARPCRFEVILPLPPAVGNNINNSAIEKILNFPNSAFTEITDAVNEALGSEQDKTPSANPAVSRYLALQCETAELPGKTLQTAEARIYGPSFKVPYQAQYSEMTLSFICTNEFYERKLFDKWMETMVPGDTNNPRFPKGATSRYLTKIRVIQYDDLIKQIYAVDLIDAFPVGISPQQLSWGEEGFHRLSVQFAYQKFETVYEGSYDLGQAAASLFGTGATRLLSI